MDPKQRPFYAILFELLLTKTIDSYLVYLSRMLSDIFARRPEMLRSKSQVTLEYVLQFATMEEFIEVVADGEVNKLAYKGLRELSDEVQRRTGILLFDKASEFERAIELVEIRNLLVHNNGVVNSVAARRLPRFRPMIGQKAQTSGIGSGAAR